MFNYIVVSFSGGKDSTAMLLRMIELDEHIDEVVCCDTYKEFPAMYRHIDRVRDLVESNGIKFTMLKAEKSFDYLMFEHEVERKGGKLNGLRGYSWAGSRLRWCTSKLKVDVINRYFRKLNETHRVITCVGLAADEQYRLERKNNQKSTHRYPLVEWGWDEKTCLEYCYNHGLDWEGLYKIFDRVSCWCCPLQSLVELRKLREHFPKLWQELIDMDERTWRKFKPNWSVRELDARFQIEDEFASLGLTINPSNEKFKAEIIRRSGGYYV